MNAIRNSFDKIYQCKYPGCRSIFTSKFSFNRHQMIHQKMKSFNCKLCGKGFYFIQQLNEHSYTHTKKRPYICGVNNCEKCFRHASELSIHRRSHPEYKLRKYHYICKSQNIETRKGIPNTFFIIHTRIGTKINQKDKISQAKETSKNTDLTKIIKSNHEESNKSSYENYGLDTKYLNFLYNITKPNNENIRTILPLPIEMNKILLK